MLSYEHNICTRKPFDPQPMRSHSIIVFSKLTTNIVLAIFGHWLHGFNTNSSWRLRGARDLHSCNNNTSSANRAQTYVTKHFSEWSRDLGSVTPNCTPRLIYAMWWLFDEWVSGLFGVSAYVAACAIPNICFHIEENPQRWTQYRVNIGADDETFAIVVQTKCN